jgi:hypothetical protein
MIHTIMPTPCKSSPTRYDFNSRDFHSSSISLLYEVTDKGTIKIIGVMGVFLNSVLSRHWSIDLEDHRAYMARGSGIIGISPVYPLPFVAPYSCVFGDV